MFRNRAPIRFDIPGDIRYRGDGDFVIWVWGVEIKECWVNMWTGRQAWQNITPFTSLYNVLKWWEIYSNFEKVHLFNSYNLKVCLLLTSKFVLGVVQLHQLYQSSIGAFALQKMFYQFSNVFNFRINCENQNQSNMIVVLSNEGKGRGQKKMSLLVVFYY